MIYKSSVTPSMSYNRSANMIKYSIAIQMNSWCFVLFDVHSWIYARFGANKRINVINAASYERLSCVSGIRA